MINKKITFAFFFLFSIILLSACATSPKSDCLEGTSKELIIRWGEFNNKSTMESFYELHTDRTISLGVRQDKNSQPKLQKIGKISEDTFCKLIKQTRDNIIQVQVLNVPSDVNNYLEYVDDKMNIHFRAIWNPNHDNKGNKEFKALFADLQTAVSEAGK